MRISPGQKESRHKCLRKINAILGSKLQKIPHFIDADFFARQRSGASLCFSLSVFTRNIFFELWLAEYFLSTGVCSVSVSPPMTIRGESDFWILPTARFPRLHTSVAALACLFLTQLRSFLTYPCRSISAPSEQKRCLRTFHFGFGVRNRNLFFFSVRGQDDRVRNVRELSRHRQKMVGIPTLAPFSTLSYLLCSSFLLNRCVKSVGFWMCFGRSERAPNASAGQTP